jgi:tetratricopeptide (TPR) repeat protein
MYRKAQVLSHLGRLQESFDLCHHLEGVLSEADPLLVDVLDAKVAVLWEREDLDEARRVLVQALEGGLGSSHSAWILWARLGQVEFGGGQMQQARSCFERAKQEAERTGDRYGLSRGLAGIATTQAESGDFDAAQETYLQVLDLSQRLGESVNGTNVLSNLGQMLSVRGLYGKSLEYANRGVQWAADTAMHGLLMRTRIIRAGVLAKLGAIDEVRLPILHSRSVRCVNR